jgi:hypothetical protein
MICVAVIEGIVEEIAWFRAMFAIPCSIETSDAELTPGIVPPARTRFRYVSSEVSLRRAFKPRIAPAKSVGVVEVATPPCDEGVATERMLRLSPRINGGRTRITNGEKARRLYFEPSIGTVV